MLHFWPDGGDMDNRMDFFLSYTAADRHWAEWIAWQLEDAGYTAGLQQWDFTAGGNFISQLETVLTSAEKVIAVVSPAYIRSTTVMSEASTGIQSERLIPVRVQPVETPAAFAGLAWVDLAGTSDAAEARERLLRAVQGGRRKPRGVPVFPGSAVGQDEYSPRFPQNRNQLDSLGRDDGERAPGPRALLVHASGDATFAVELADSLRTLLVEGCYRGSTCTRSSKTSRKPAGYGWPPACVRQKSRCCWSAVICWRRSTARLEI